VAAQKVKVVLAADAQVKVISPRLIPELQKMVDSGVISFTKHVYQDGDLEGVFLATAATNDPSENHIIYTEATKRGCLIDVVVRLKGDDPFVFGHGGEEAQSLAAAEIPFEIIPGVTSAISVPAYAGISVTQRGMACNMAFVTGHCAGPQPLEIN